LENIPGLRNAQLGAIHAIATFHTLHKKNAGIIIMPTGSGKTAVLMMTPYIVHAKKILVVTPSVMVRGQIYEDFANLITLKGANVFPKTLIPPKVYELKNKYSDVVREDVEIADVVVASPPCALSLSESAIKNIFNLVLVDEAHHVPARTWQKILINMNEASHYLFTATPFRSDKKEIKGEILYSYPLSMAYRDGIFGEITYIPIEKAPDKDKLVAKEAERVFFDDRQKGYDHYLMVRTDTKKKAKGLEQLYKEQTSLKLERIDSSMTFKVIKSYIEALKNKRIDGIICVDMLGEGFDFPNLKIAAVHTPHKSLASTLQFIGRFARTNAENIGPAKFIAMNDADLVIENKWLFTNDAVWQEMIIDMSEQTIREEEEVKKNLKEYVRDDGLTAVDDLISLYSLRPNCHAKVYHISGFNIQGAFPDAYSVGDRVYRNQSENTVVGIGTIYSRPRWITTDRIMDIENLLFIVHYQKETSLLFIYSQMKNEIDYETIAGAFTEGFDKIPRNEIHRVLAEFQSYEMFNTGMRNRYAENGLSYLIQSGPDVAASIDPTAGRTYAAGHVFCKANSDINKNVTIGYSSGSKMWSSSYVSITEYVRWCNENGKKIVNSSMVVRTNTNYDFIPIPTRISEFPDKVFFVLFSDKTFSSPPIWINHNGEPTNVLLTDAIIRLEYDDVSKNKITFSVTLEETTDSLVYTPDGRYTCDQPNIFLKYGRNELSLVEYFNKIPLIFKTLDDSVIEGDEITIWASEIDIFMPDEINGIDWDKYMADIRCEFGETINGKKSIQDALFEILNESNKYTYLIFDHGTGEIADYITITENDNIIETVLYHVKAMSGRKYNNNLKDIYEVTQQAIKSMIWLNSQKELLNKIRLRRESNHCRLKKGNYNDLEKTLKQEKPFTAKIVIVQPAISQSIDFPARYQEVLAATRFYINSSRRFTLEIWGSK
jgi:DNA or RNA helicases of superfamily II